MTENEWFIDEFKMAENFQMTLLPLVCSVEAQNREIKVLEEQKKVLEAEIGTTYFKESQLRILGQSIKILEEDNKKKFTKIKQVKEEYIAEDFVGNLETLTSANGGLEVSEAACELMKRVTDLLREAKLENY